MTDEPTTERLFSYGTLQQAEVQLATFGRLLQGEPDTLPGYRCGKLMITDPDVLATSGLDHHLIAMPSDDPADVIEGMVFLITATELAAADAYEVDDYKRVAVRLRSDGEAWVYVKA